MGQLSVLPFFVIPLLVHSHTHKHAPAAQHQIALRSLFLLPVLFLSLDFFLSPTHLSFFFFLSFSLLYYLACISSSFVLIFLYSHLPFPFSLSFGAFDVLVVT